MSKYRARRSITAIAALSAAFASIAFAPASAVAAENTQHCQSITDLRSQDGYQSADVKICAEYIPTSNAIRTDISLSKIEYSYAGSWHHNSYPVQLKGEVVQTRDNATSSSAKYGATSSTTSVSSFVTLTANVPGVYRVVLDGELTGGYWDETNTSHIEIPTLTFVIPVAANGNFDVAK